MDGSVLIKDSLVDLVKRTVQQAQGAGKLPPVTLPEVTIERPQNSQHGDYATSFALKLARGTGIKPMEIAGQIAGLIGTGTDMAHVTVAPPGFINFTLRNDWLARQVDTILSAGETYGNINLGSGSRVQVEFVSVNPTGPLHVGHGRGAILGSTLASALTAAGYAVEKEYYLNDAGNQILAFFRSLYARYRQCLNIEAEMPSDGYLGNYVVEMAKEVVGRDGDRFLKLPPDDALQQLGEAGLQKMVQQIRADLERLGVSFDVWFSERSLYTNGQYERAMSFLRGEGHIAEKEGATWFVSTALGEDKDNVVVRGDGTPTYFASDIAYHYNKFLERKFDKVINIWGADHQGHVSRMKAAVGAMGIDPERLVIIISQMVTLRRGEEQVRLSKRSGDIVTLREVVDEVGVDACRFFFLCRSADAQMDFDLELAKKQSTDNPVYYVQYAHARIASILRLAEQRGIDFQAGDVSRLTSPPEMVLIRKMLLLPELIETVSLTLQPHHLTYYAQDLATVFHAFYKDCRVVSDDLELSRARLKLVAAVRTVLARTLHLMGMTAPDRM